MYQVHQWYNWCNGFATAAGYRPFLFGGELCPRTISLMRRGRRKGKVSNDLVAASCAAVLAVYTAGYLRTRDAARQFEAHTKERRSVARMQSRAVIDPKAPAIEAVASQPPPEQQASAASAEPMPMPSAPERPSAVRKSKRATVPAAAVIAAASAPPLPDVAGPPSPPAVPSIAPVPLPTAESTAASPVPIDREPAPAVAVKWRDGTFSGLGYSPHGNIEARVVIKDGRIVESGILTCDTRYPCSVIDPLIHQPVVRQSPDVDYMSHATESSDAYYDALVEALMYAREPASGEAPIPK
jgi:uncharacterized protein with FMN-binding domain